MKTKQLYLRPSVHEIQTQMEGCFLTASGTYIQSSGNVLDYDDEDFWS